ncbi:MAG: DUF624 domain-containing protein [Oscillospiraceae bacterium]|nr:DUF624 domain-containing protein [Oscillospiraceae bacterium]
MAFFGFFDYASSGAGVAKDAPVKRPFFKFWELFARKFWKFFQVNLIYFLFCLPIVTIGPATVAMTQIMRKFTLEQPIFIFDEFLDSFKKNFKQGLIIGLFDIVFVVALTFSLLYYFYQMGEDSSLMNIAMTSITLATGGFIIMMHFYIFPQIAALKLTMNQIIKNSFFLAVLGIKSNVVTLLVLLAFLVGMLMTFTISVLFLPLIPMAWISFVSVFNSYPVIQKYIINPYYEKRGEKNPEIPDYSADGDTDDEDDRPLFEDFGGREAAFKADKSKSKSQHQSPQSKPKIKGKVIK